MNASRSLTFLWTPLAVALGILAVITTAAFCFVAWRRKGFTLGAGLMEGLRLCIVTLVAITLNQPELLQQDRPDERPTLVVLSDVSRSMETRDVIDPAHPSLPPVTRRESLQPIVKESLWKPVSARWNVVFESFASSLEDPAAGTDLGAALDDSLARHKHLRGIVLLSDGDWNAGQPPAQAASRLRLHRVPVFAVAVGSESRLPDLEIARIDAPTFAVVGKTLRIPFVIDSALPRDYDASIRLTSSSGQEVTKNVTVPAMSRLEDTILWEPKQTGDFEFVMRVPPHPDELVSENNQRAFPLSIREETLKVLLVESYPRWEYRYLRNALQRDPGVEVSCLLYHPGLSKVGGGSGYVAAFPGTLEELAKYDVVFLGDVGVGTGQLTMDQCRLLKGLVQNQASGLIFMPGLRGGHHSLSGTELEDLYPVVLDAAQPRGWGSRTPAQFELTESGRRSLLTKLEDSEEANARLWETLPGFQWYAPVLRAKAGSEVLATHRSETTAFGRIPLLVTKTYGTGKIVFMGTDGAWRWREGVEDRYHYRFWGQVVRWMAYQRTMAQGEFMRLFYSPDRPQTGDVVRLNANVMSAGGEPLQEGTVITQIVAPSGKTESIRLAPSGDQWGLFTSSYTPKEHGQYRLKLMCRENGSSLETALHVQDAGRETLGRPARCDVLEEIASITRGKLIRADRMGDLLTDLRALPEPEPTVRRLRLWCHPLWAGFLVVLLGIFWSGRKMIGAI